MISKLYEELKSGSKTKPKVTFEKNSFWRRKGDTNG
jgi:hypothetical protein